MTNSQDMATSKVPISSNSQVEEDYIDMELSSSSSNCHFYSSMVSSPQHSREFEFQMFSTSQDKESSTSPADELFYKGKLLPLHLPPRLQMVQKLFQNTTTIENQSNQEPLDEKCGSIPSSSNSNNVPLESCNISPSESCRVSCELNPEEYYLEWSTEINGFIGNQPKKSWPKKLKKSSIGQRIKDSSAYLKSLFGKSACTNDFCAKAAPSVEELQTSSYTASKSKEFACKKYTKITNNGLFGRTDNERHKASKSNTLLKSIEKEMVEDGFITKRRSFSGVIQWSSGNKSLSSSSMSISSSGSSSSSSSFSVSSSGFYDLHFLKRSGSANSELESSVEGAIAHCKKSQQMFNPRKVAGDVVGGNCSLSVSGIKACEGGQLESPKIVRV